MNRPLRVRLPARALAVLLVGAVSLLSGRVRGELPSIRFDRLQPLGAAAGSTFDAQISGNDLEGVQSLLFDHPGLRAEPVEGKERTFRISVASDVPCGTYDVRLVGRFGVSNPRLLAVTRGLKDVTEVEPNNTVEQSQGVPINAALHGVSDQNDQDVFRVAVRKGQRITIECQAGCLDSALDATLTLTTRAGAPLATNGDYRGRDPFLDFVAPAADEYLVIIADLSFRGGHPYQLVVSDLPHLENVQPRAVQPGTTTELIAYGRNLGAAASPSPWRIHDLPLEQLRIAVTPPGDVGARGAFRFVRHPTDHSTLPTAATCTLTGFQVLAGLPNELGPAIPVVVSEHAVVTEQEPNDDREHPQRLTLPAMISGRFDQPRDADWYEIESPQAVHGAVDVYCERLGGRADPYVAVFDDQGNRVAELDDYGHRVNAFDGHLRDPSGSVNLAAGRKYRLLVQDRYRRGSARSQYVLSVRPPRGDFYASVIHSPNPGPAGVTVWKGGQVHLDVVVHQTEGFSGEITIQGEELPAGLRVAPTTLHGNSGVVVLSADEGLADWTGTIGLVAQGKRGDELLTREVRPTTRVWTDTNMPGSRPTRRLAVAIRDSAPMSLRFAQDAIDVEAGQKVELVLKLTRRWPDFTSSVTVLPLAFPGGFQLPNQEIAAGATEVKLPLQVASGTRPGLYTITVLGQAQVPFAKDPQATSRPNTLVSLPSWPIQVTVRPRP